MPRTGVTLPTRVRLRDELLLIAEIPDMRDALRVKFRRKGRSYCGSCAYKPELAASSPVGCRSRGLFPCGAHELNLNTAAAPRSHAISMIGASVWQKEVVPGSAWVCLAIAEGSLDMANLLRIYTVVENSMTYGYLRLLGSDGVALRSMWNPEIEGEDEP